ncbi:Secreted protein OS=Streptomyces alboniger OX=132473 GN=CP975_01505 PE=4 SV=1 [Streptomyces alboniger]
MAEGDSLYVTVPACGRSAEIRVPTVKDDVREPVESLKARLSLQDEDWEPLPGGPVFTGTVRDAG